MNAFVKAAKVALIKFGKWLLVQPWFQETVSDGLKDFTRWLTTWLKENYSKLAKTMSDSYVVRKYRRWYSSKVEHAQYSDDLFWEQTAEMRKTKAEAKAEQKAAKYNAKVEEKLRRMNYIRRPRNPKEAMTLVTAIHSKLRDRMVAA